MYDWKGFKGVVVVQRVQIIEPKCWIHTCTYHAHGLRTPRGVQAVITTPMSHSSCFWKLCEKVESSYHRLFKYVLCYYKVCISYTSCKFSIASNVCWLWKLQQCNRLNVMHGCDTYLKFSSKYILQYEIDVCKLFSLNKRVLRQWFFAIVWRYEKHYGSEKTCLHFCNFWIFLMIFLA